MEKPSSIGTERRTIRIKTTLAKKIDEMAENDNRTFNNMVETLLLRETQRYGVAF